jgi:zinc transport system ATP-binding protein
MAQNLDPVLKVSNLTAETQRYKILEDINFEVYKGTTLAIVGPNGSGKSTLFQSLLGFYPHTGDVWWRDGLKRSYIPQKIAIGEIPITAEEFLGLKGKNIDEVLKEVELDPAEIKGKLLRVLSGGEFQRVLIAWALMDEPDILLFDEPTSGIDVGHEETVFSLLEKLKQEKQVTLLLISHDLHVVDEYADYVMILNKRILDYRKIEETSIAQILEIVYGRPITLYKGVHTR